MERPKVTDAVGKALRTLKPGSPARRARGSRPRGMLGGEGRRLRRPQPTQSPHGLAELSVAVEPMQQQHGRQHSNSTAQ